MGIHIVTLGFVSFLSLSFLYGQCKDLISFPRGCDHEELEPISPARRQIVQV